MAEDDKIRYRDIIEPDDSIEGLIKEISDLNKTYASMLSLVQDGANKLIKAVTSMSSATSQGRKAIEDSAVATTRLERAQQELAFALSETGKQVAWLKAQTSDANKLSVTQQRSVSQIAGSYTKLKAELSEMITLYKSLSEAERNEAGMGGMLLQEIVSYRSQLKELDNQLKGIKPSLTEVEKAEQKLAFAQSAEGQRLAELRAEIKEVNRAYAESTKTKQLEAGSYEAINKTLQEAKALYKSMSEANRTNPAIGGVLAKDIRDLETGLAGILNEIKPVATALTEVEKAEQKLAATQTASAQRVAEVNAQTREARKELQLTAQMNNSAVGSYNELQARLQQLIASYKALSTVERESSQGQALIIQIRGLSTQLSDITNAAKPAVTALTEVEKAEQKLLFLYSAEGQRLLDLKEKIQRVINAHKRQSEVANKLAAAQQKLAFAQSAENEQLKLLDMQTKQANKEAELRVQINNSAVGSYNRLSAQYQLVKLKLNALSTAEREGTKAGRDLEKTAAALYTRMRVLQEATGSHALSIGNYGKVWNGLGFSVAQVVRELPAAAVSLNTFFLAISNNIPMMVDEINKLRLQNKALQAEGKPTISITKQITKAIFGWNTALVLILTAFSLFGKQIVDWVSKVFTGQAAAISFEKALKNIAKELKNTNASYGDNIVRLGRLTDAYNRLKTTAEKTRWIKNNTSEFNNLGISVNSVSEAENAFINNTATVIEALKARARAAAAEKLAAEKYEEELVKRNEAETKRKTKPDNSAKAYSYGTRMGAMVNTGGAGGVHTRWSYEEAQSITPLQAHLKAIGALEKEADVAKATADQYFELAQAERQAASEALRNAGIRENTDRDRKTGNKGREPRDLTDTINRNDINIRKQYEASVTELIKDEYAKRRKAAADEVQTENDKLRELYRKNEEYVNNVNGKYKALTDEQRERVEEQQRLIKETIANNLKALSLQIQQIQKEQQINATQLQRETQVNTAGVSPFSTTITSDLRVEQDTSGLEASLVKERQLVEENLNIEYSLITESNKRLIAAGDSRARSEEGILLEWNKKRVELWAEYDEKIINLRKQNIEDQLELVEKGGEDELELQVALIEAERQLALSKNAAAPAEQQVSSDTINAKFDKRIKLAKGSNTMERFDQEQARKAAEFNTEKHDQDEITKFKLEQERDRWNKQIELAKSGGLDWSKTQIETAELTVKGIGKQIDEIDDVWNKIAKKGLGGTLLDSLGFNDEQIDALEDAVNRTIGFIKDIMAAEIELAEKAVEAAEKRVAAAEKVYDAQVEAHNNGYANDMKGARRDVELERKRQAEKQKILEKAQKRQLALDTAMQASSLVSASANIWAAFSKEGPHGPALAIAAIAAMWASFAAAKIKAKQVTAVQEGSDEYGEGGLEFLEGGSHASGRDINLNVKNKKKRNMRAEGGEALAIINKRSTHKYKKVLPELVKSLNKGTFEDKYLKAFEHGEALHAQIHAGDSINIDLSQLEKEVREIKKQNALKYYVLADGSTVILNGNTKKIIRS